MKSSTPIRKKLTIKGLKDKEIPKKRRIYLLFPVLIILSIAGYFLFGGNGNSLKPDVKSPPSFDKVRAKTDFEKDKDFPLMVEKAKLQVESADNTDRLKILIEDANSRKRHIQYNYEWFKNGTPFGNNTDSVTGFKKGDKIDVKITPFNGDKYGKPRLLSMEISHVTPRIIENKEVTFDGNTLSHRVKAVIPGGGTVTYSLVEAPEGMKINGSTGVLTWQTKEGDHGKYDIKVGISDGNGAEIIYPLHLDLGATAR